MGAVRELEIGLIDVAAVNTRKDLKDGQEDSDIQQLAEDIRKRGLLQYPVVRRTPAGRYEVISGQRRLLACRQLGWQKITVVERSDLDDVAATEVSLAENLHRADMHPLDKARAFQALFGRRGSCEAVAKEMSVSTATVRKYLDLLKLPDELQEELSAAGGHIKTSAMAKLANTFSGQEAVQAYRKIKGFTQQVQVEILNRSEGNIKSIDQLVGEAVAGAFDIKSCGGIYRCGLIEQLVEEGLSKRELARAFKESVGAASEEMQTPKKGWLGVVHDIRRLLKL